MEVTKGTVWSNVFTIALAIWLIVLLIVRGSALVRRDHASQANATLIKGDWKALYRDRTPTLGSRSAFFQIVEFSDYQCPYCRLVDPVLVRFVERHPTHVAVYRYNLPLIEIHKFALPAAIAAECAAYQGVLEPYQALIFQHQAGIPSVDWNVLARQGGVSNLAVFATCINKEQPREHILHDVIAARKLGITSTPTFIIGGNVYNEGMTEDTLEALYRDAEKVRGGVFSRFLDM